jgi:hypothetical protein
VTVNLDLGAIVNTIFYSWQSDRPTGVCRNFIERCTQSAIDRLRADVEIDESLREELQVDKDTKDVPGTPAIFDTIMAKIETAGVFVSDLSFVGQRADGRPTSNPNVLIEYGYALANLGSERIIGVVNDSYGKPTNVNLPFNLAHTRFPITYTLAENSSEEDRKTARNTLTKNLEVALRTVFESAAYKAEVQSARPPSALEIAAVHQEELDLEAEISALRYGDGPTKVQGLAEALFQEIESAVQKVTASHDFGIECGSTFEQIGQNGSCVLKTSAFGIVVNWHRAVPNSSEETKLSVRHFEGRLFLPGEFQGGVHINQPRLTSEIHYEPIISRSHQLGWVQKMKARSEPSFLSSSELAESCISQVLNTIRRRHQSR